MSRVTNAILAYSLGEDRSEDDEGFVQLEAVNKFFEGGELGFVSVKDRKLPPNWYGGSKRLEVNLAIGAFNYLDTEGLLRHLGSISWSEPRQVQLIVSTEGDDFETMTPAFPSLGDV